jgi:lipoate-protein ligase B
MPICQVLDLGLIAYQPAWDLQNRLVAEIARGERPDTLLLLEHPHTYTFGRRGKVENLLWDEKKLAENGVSVCSAGPAWAGMRPDQWQNRRLGAGRCRLTLPALQA